MCVAVEMSLSQVSARESIKIKKNLYIGGVDEYSSSSQPLNSKAKNEHQLLAVYIKLLGVQLCRGKSGFIN